MVGDILSPLAESLPRLLGPYELTAPLGAGGMGEVYRARDTRLGREVAVKILPAGYLDDPSRRARFENESKALAALNHPNIVAVHDVGDGYLVEELVNGETLTRKGRVSPKSAADIGAQIAEGLAAAHRVGIVHRDLKPDNVMVTPEGRVKILDFGLARYAGPVAPEDSTLTALSGEGDIMGTPGYMAPEQARGQVVDHRADIFSLGVVLYELLVGERAFPGSTAADRLAACLHKDLTLPVERVPLELRRIVERCLDKEPGARWQSAADLSANLRWTEGGSASGIAPVSSPAPTWPWRAACVVLALAACGLGWLAWRSPEPGAEPVQRLMAPGAFTSISPNGRLLAQHAADGIHLRDLSTAEDRVLAGTKGGSPRASICWSPDSTQLCYFAGGQLWKARFDGSPPVRLAEAPDGRGASWGSGVILFAPTPWSGIHKVSDGGGPAEAVTKLDAARGDVEQIFPVIVPGSGQFLFTARSRNREASGLFAREISGGSVDRLVTPTYNQALLVPERQGSRAGYLLTIGTGGLEVQGIDLGTLKTTAPSLVAAATGSAYGTAYVSASETGRLLLSDVYSSNGQFAWLDRAGRAEGSASEPVRSPFTVDLSPSGKLAAVTFSGRAALVDAATLDVSPLRIEQSTAHSYLPVWGPAGQQLAHVRNQRPLIGIISSADGRGANTAVHEGGYIWDWSRDGRFLLCERTAGGNGLDLMTIDMSQPADRRTPVPYVATRFAESHGRFSPDGRFVAYTSNASGQDEVWVESFPVGNGKWMVSRDGGSQPRWRRDGKEIFYYSADNKITSVPVKLDAGFVPGAPQPLFEVFLHRAIGWQYDASVDGQRFFIIKSDRPRNSTLILNWPAMLKKP